jgi:hypothetical protein
MNARPDWREEPHRHFSKVIWSEATKQQKSFQEPNLSHRRLDLPTLVRLSTRLQGAIKLANAIAASATDGGLRILPTRPCRQTMSRFRLMSWRATVRGDFSSIGS